MLACEAGNLAIVEALVRKGADINLADTLGHNALHYSKLSENTGIQSLLQSKIVQDAGRSKFLALNWAASNLFVTSRTVIESL